MIMTEEEKIQSANRGREFWLSNGLEQYDFVLLLISDNLLLNTELLKCFQKRLERDKKRGAILSVNRTTKQNRCECFQISSQTIQDIMQLYCMYEFTDRLIIGSTDEPHGNRLENLLALDGFPRVATVEQVLFQM